MAKDKTAVKDKKRDKGKKRSPEEVTKVLSMDEEVMNREGEPSSAKRKKKRKEVVEEDHVQSDVIESEVKIETGEKKKKKKKKSSSDISEDTESIIIVDLTEIEEQPADAEVKEEEKKKKKKKKKSSSDISEDTESIIIVDLTEIEEQPADAEVKEEEKKKKKKKKSQSKEDINSEEGVPPDCEGGKKKKNGEALTTVKDCDISAFDSAEKDSVETPKKTKKKKKRLADENNGGIEGNGFENGEAFTTVKDCDISAFDSAEKASVETPKKTKKKKKRLADENNGGIEENGSENTNRQKADIEGEVTVEERKKEKKKKKKQESLEEDACITTEHKKEKKKKKDSSHVKDMANTATESQLETLEEKNMDGKTKKGKKKTDISEAHELQNNMQGEKKKQKKKKAEEVEPTQQLVDEEKDKGDATEAVNQKKRKKSKNDSSKTCIEVETPTPKKKKNISEESTPAKTIKEEKNQSVEEHQEVTEVVFLSEKPGNSDEILIDQERRLALQREIDQESQPKSTFGQWGSATFDSSDKQQKFLRLMGGFKKGNQPAASGVGRPNMALGKEEQQSLQQKLLGQFECAQNRRMDFTNKGAGLGFTAPSNKKFSIDVNSSRSIKFDD
ncbi:lysine-rich nucleolar protein 1 isoform X2 [Sardina pilchardus]|uniref:lysine-rich nucleolar protein 1 isoform X2 n=1 Tax=Sardina pilchardus TaxID=27697 RepID=UPI002E1315A1